MDRLGKPCGEIAQVCGCIRAMFGDQIDQRRANHHAIGHPGDGAGLFGRAHAEADRDGNIGCALDPADIGFGRFTAASIESCAALCLPVMPATET